MLGSLTGHQGWELARGHPDGPRGRERGLNSTHHARCVPLRPRGQIQAQPWSGYYGSQRTESRHLTHMSTDPWLEVGLAGFNICSTHLRSSQPVISNLYFFLRDWVTNVQTIAQGHTT